MAIVSAQRHGGAGTTLFDPTRAALGVHSQGQAVAEAYRRGLVRGDAAVKSLTARAPAGSRAPGGRSAGAARHAAR